MSDFLDTPAPESRTATRALRWVLGALLFLALVGAVLVWTLVAPFLESELHAAARAGDLARLHALLEAGADPNEVLRRPDLVTDFDGGEPNTEATIVEVTPLFLAAFGGHADAAELLLEAGADPRFHGGEKAPTLLEVAVASSGDPRLVELLVDAGAYPWPALEDAALRGSWREFHALAKAWDELGYLDGDRAKLRGFSDRGGQQMAIREWLHRRDEPQLFEEARSGGAIDVAWGSLHRDAATESVYGWTALHWAAAGPSAASKVTSLLSMGADPGAASATGMRPLAMAIGNGRLDAAEVLLAAGADPNAADDTGWTPLHEAVRRQAADAVRLLLEAGADPDAEDERGRTPRSLAADRDRTRPEGHRAPPLAPLLR